ncbi:hypothetical protein Hypma_008318 [Hypsizygus marmoreus]|uniref:NACHT domain-containing protein n=1 Tax=Hypsizygus marmoreus TaxID=39966 RepID=A0A369JRR7_HYPMA|nr:hypothetical protein Hypma_008318 [Hypsizygus marmoreus]
MREASTGAAHDSLERHPPPRCHPGTRTELLNKIHGCIRDAAETKSESIIWLHGPAGSGKSAIAQTIAESCDERRQLAASFFFSRGRPHRDTIKYLFTTIAFQLAMSTPDRRRKINKVVVDDPSVIHKAPSIQLNKLIIEPLQNEWWDDHFPFLIVIDGLDECRGNVDQSQILSYIFHLNEWCRLPLCFLIASRPEPHIGSAFRTQNIYTAISLYRDFEALQDICAYLCDGFCEIQDSEKHADTMNAISKPWPDFKMVSLLVDRSGGYFIYASTILRYIDEEYFSPLDRLAEVLKCSSPAPFSELDKLYHQILSVSQDTRLLKRILWYSLHGDNHYFRCLGPAVEGVFQLRPGASILALRGLHSLLWVDTTLDFGGNSHQIRTIKPFHASLLDFLFDPQRAGKFFIDIEENRIDFLRESLRVFTKWASTGRNISYVGFTITIAYWQSNL